MQKNKEQTFLQLEGEWRLRQLYHELQEHATKRSRRRHSGKQSDTERKAETDPLLSGFIQLNKRLSATQRNKERQGNLPQDETRILNPQHLPFEKWTTSAVFLFTPWNAVKRKKKKKDIKKLMLNI